MWFLFVLRLWMRSISRWTPSLEELTRGRFSLWQRRYHLPPSLHIYFNPSPSLSSLHYWPLTSFISNTYFYPFSSCGTHPTPFLDLFNLLLVHRVSGLDLNKTDYEEYRNDELQMSKQVDPMKQFSECVTAAFYLSPVLAFSWLCQARPSDEPDGTRTDGGQDELLRRSTSQYTSKHFYEHFLLMLVVSHNIVSFGCRSQRLIYWTPKKTWRRSWKRLFVSRATSRTMESCPSSNMSSSLFVEVKNFSFCCHGFRCFLHSYKECKMSW